MVLLDWALLAVRQTLDEPTSESRAPALYGIIGSLGPLALIAVVVRFYTRIRFAKLGWDDMTIAIGLILYTGLIVTTGYCMYAKTSMSVAGGKSRLTSILTCRHSLRPWDALLVS